jgi:hypothetical protein
MKRILIALLLSCTALPALAEPMPSQIYEGYQRPPKQPMAKGYVTEDGKRYGTCKNRAHHGRHPHCKERVPLPKPKPVPAKPAPVEPPADAKVIKVPQ